MAEFYIAQYCVGYRAKMFWEQLSQVSPYLYIEMFENQI